MSEKQVYLIDHSQKFSFLKILRFKRRPMCRFSCELSYARLYFPFKKKKGFLALKMTKKLGGFKI